MDDLVEEFLVETSESLNELDVDIVNLEQNPNDSELIGKIFRLVHTIKGTCGFLSLPKLEKVAHHSENVLGRFRDKDLEVTPEYVTLILNAFDRIKEIVSVIEDTGSEPDGDDAELIARLDVVFELGREGEIEDVIDDDIFPVMVVADDEEDKPQETEDEISEDVFEPIPVEGAEFKATETEPEKTTEEKTVIPVKAVKTDVNAGGAKKVQKPVTQSLRVNVQVLEDLMTMVSELVLTRNQLLQLSRTQQNTDFAAPLQNLNQVVSELQEGVMKTRMQPVGNAWQKLPRIVRDLSVDLDKKINFEMQGEDTELDRQVLEMIKDPLTHMVRNSGDHGIEMPAERLAAGKAEEGHILLNAFHEGGHIIIEISDDGKGLPLDKIKKKAIDNNIYTTEEMEEMPDQQIQQLIFHAGFSTAEKVTSVSGRGVGMDVVRTNIEKIGGAVELSSQEGKGSTFRIKIPLTLAIVSALLIEVAGEKFALPQINVQELVRISNETVHSIEKIKDTPVLRLRDRLLPLVSLQDLLELEDVQEIEEDLEKALGEGDEDKEPENIIKIETKKEGVEESSNCYVIVLHVGSHTFGVMVDKVFDTEEIVVKPVSEILKDIPLYSGNTILGDGSVIMILDPNGIANAVGGGTLSDKDTDSFQGEEAKRDQGKFLSLLAFNAGNGAPLAVPLSLISRLEEIKVGDIELSGGQRVVQYRDKLMPLVPFDENFKMKEDGRQAVLVFSDRDRSMGLLVDSIVDIVETDVDIQLTGDENGLLGSAIVNGQAMDIIDVGHYMSLAYADWFNVEVQTGFGHDGNTEKRILLVDDSSFFRNMLTPILSVSGYQVVAVDNPFQALELCSSGKIFDMIISDIEMPEMDGFEFAEKVKSDDSVWKDIPLVALSSHAAPEDFERGHDAGFNDYITKFDRDALLKSIEKNLSKKEGVA